MNVGEEIDCTCPRCSIILPHVILYFEADGRIGGVQCRTCGLQHPYRSYRSGRVRRPAPGPETLIPLLQGGSFQDRLTSLKKDEVLAYRTDRRFRIDDVIRHPRFGIGFVLRVRKSRIDVLFEDAIKVLIHAVEEDTMR